MSNIFKVNNKNNRTSCGGSIVNFEHILHFIIIIIIIIIIIVEFNQISVV